MSVLHVYASDQPLLELVLERFIGDHETDHAATLELIGAMDDLTRDWLLPLGVAAWIECLDPNTFDVAPAPVPHHFLRAAELHPELRVDIGYIAARETVVSTLDPATRLLWLESALEQSCTPGREVALAELRWTIMCARLPGRIELYHGDREASSIIEEHDGVWWALGQRTPSPVGPPARVRAVNTHGSLELRLDVYWDAWTVHAEGRALVGRGVERVVARGHGWACRQVFPSVG